MIGGMKPAEAAEHLADVLATIKGTVIFATCVDQRGFVGDSDCFVSREREIHELPVEYVLDFPRETKASAAMLTSRIPGSISCPGEELIGFTRSVLENGRETGVDLLDHYLVTDSGLISMRATTDLWN